MADGVSIRPATTADIPWLLDLMAEMHAMSGTPVPFIPSAALAELATGIVSSEMLCLVVEGKAVIAAGVANTMGVKIAHERVWITREPGLGLRLMRAYEAWARERGCDFIRLNPRMGDTRTERLLGIAGYAPAETAWAKAL